LSLAFSSFWGLLRLDGIAGIKASIVQLVVVAAFAVVKIATSSGTIVAQKVVHFEYLR